MVTRKNLFRNLKSFHEDKEKTSINKLIIKMGLIMNTCIIFFVILGVFIDIYFSVGWIAIAISSFVGIILGWYICFCLYEKKY